jgi:hypothetical protein
MTTIQPVSYSSYVPHHLVILLLRECFSCFLFLVVIAIVTLSLLFCFST